MDRDPARLNDLRPSTYCLYAQLNRHRPTGLPHPAHRISSSRPPVIYGLAIFSPITYSFLCSLLITGILLDEPGYALAVKFGFFVCVKRRTTKLCCGKITWTLIWQVQRHLQLRIEAQGKYLQSVLEKAQEALAKQSADVDAGSLQEELLAKRQHGAGDGSVDSCLTREHDMLSIGLCAPRGTGSTCEEYMFLQQEPSRAASSPDDHCARLSRTPELDLSMNHNTCRPHGSDKIDLNDSSWN